MKANKALKRLTRIDSLMTDLVKGFSKGSLQVRQELQDAKAAFARAKAAVESHVSSTIAMTHLKETPEPAKRNLKTATGKQAIQEGERGRMAQKKDATAETGQSKKKAAPARKKAAAKTMTATTPAAMTAKRRVPLKKAAKKNAGPKKMAHTPVKLTPTVETAPEVETAPGEMATAATPPDVEAQPEPAAQMSAGN